jgi:proline racemase
MSHHSKEGVVYLMQSQQIYQTIDMHTAGEPLRLIVSGVPLIPGSTMLDKRAYFREHLDHIRRVLMFEPRGHNDMYGCVITPPVSPQSDMGVLFMHNEGFSTMCGHGIIAVVTYAVQNGLVRDPAHIRIDSPAGLVKARANVDGERVMSVSFENVPSFVFKQGLNLAGIPAEIAFGGAFYVLAESPLPITGSNLSELRALGMKMKREAERSLDVIHPDEPGLRGIYGTIFTSAPSETGAHRRNVTIFAEGEADRSPCGTGTCAVMASRFVHGLLHENAPFVHESIVGTAFTGRVMGRTKVHSYDAVIPEVEGSAFITGYHTFVVDPNDPVANGFRIG